MTDNTGGDNGDPGGGGNGGGGGGGGGETSWLDALPEGMRGDRNLAKYESLEAFATGHLNALKRFGKDPNRMIELPEKPDDEAGWSAVHAALGRPEKPEAYQITLADGASDQDKAFVEGFRAIAHKAGMSQAQVGAAVGYLNEVTAQAGEAATAAREAETAKVQTDLKSAWGDKYDVYSQEIGKLLTDLGEEGLIDELNERGLGNSVGLNKLLAKIVDLRAEPETPEGGNKDGGAGKRPNTPYQAQAELGRLHGDPEKMKALNDASHPNHKNVLAEREALLKQAYPAQA